MRSVEGIARASLGLFADKSAQEKARIFERVTNKHCEGKTSGPASKLPIDRGKG